MATSIWPPSTSLGETHVHFLQHWDRIMTTGSQKVAVITGASQGIGAALVQAYRKQGWAVVANSRSIEDSDDAGVFTVTGDIADPAVARNVIEVAVREFGGVDTLVNNAGVFVAKPFSDYTTEDYQALVGVNLTGSSRRHS
jgi:NAD(P)-dependent dehydrogenase (short-subunit alcohol dehydrogenase family)